MFIIFTLALFFQGYSYHLFQIKVVMENQEKNPAMVIMYHSTFICTSVPVCRCHRQNVSKSDFLTFYSLKNFEIQYLSHCMSECYETKPGHPSLLRAFRRY